MKNVLSVGVVPVRIPEVGSEPLFLLLRVYNYWDFPKGIREKRETEIEGALRELQEETGIDHVQFTWGEGFIETEPYSYGKIARYYIAQVHSDEVKLLINPALGKAEHHEYGWFTYQEARSKLVPRVKAVLEWAKASIASD